MAAMRYTALNIIKATTATASIKIRRKTFAWDDEYLFSEISQSPN